MRDLEDLLRRAVPRLRKDDDGAKKIRRRLIKMAADACAEGPKRLRALGVEVKRAPALEGDEGERLATLREALGDDGFEALFRALKDELAEQLGKPKEKEPKEEAKKSASSSSSGRTKRASSGRQKASSSGRASSKSGRASSSSGRTSSSSGRAKRASGSGRLTMSSHEELTSTSELALPPDDAVLALPPDEGEADAPLSIQFDAGAPAASKAAPARDEDDTDPTRAADRALARYRQTGDPAELEQAKKLYARAAKAAESDLARGAARAGLAQACLLEGDAAKATEHAEKALALFPDEPTAVRTLLRAARAGEGEREKVTGALARARVALRSKDWDGALKVGKELDALAPKEPFGPMVALAVQHERGDKKGIDAALARVWERYPASVGLADLPLGPELERPLALAALLWVRERIEKDGGAALEKTVKDVDSKQNVISGAVQLGLGVARAALATRDKLSANDEQELRKWVGQGLLAAQYYDHAKEVLGQARALDRNGNHVLEINKDETQCGVMKRAFDKPGVKAKTGKLDGVGIVQFRKAVAARLQTVLAAKDEALGGYEQDEDALVEALLAAPERKKKLEARAKKAGVPSPFARVDAVEDELAALEAKGEPAAPEEPAAPGGLFGRMKSGLSKAVDKAKTAAKNAELSLRKGVAASKKKEASRALAIALRDAPEGGWGDAALDALVGRWRALSARVEALDEEAEALRKAAGKAGSA